ncbi:MAG: hypothetical protein RR235_09575 [Oscillospiraceae bacterium]
MLLPLAGCNGTKKDMTLADVIVMAAKIERVPSDKVSDLDLGVSGAEELLKMSYEKSKNDGISYVVEYNKDSDLFVVHIYTETAALVVDGMKTDKELHSKKWDKLLRAAASLSQSAYGLVLACGVDVPTLVIVQGAPSDNLVLCAAQNGKTIYDVTE